MLLNEYANEIMGEHYYRKSNFDNPLYEKIQNFLDKGALIGGGAESIESDGTIAAMAASIFWQVVHRSVLFSSMRPDMKAQVFVVPQGDNNYHLAILIESDSIYWQYARPDYLTVRNLLQPSDIQRAFHIWRNQFGIKDIAVRLDNNYELSQAFGIPNIITSEDIIDYMRYQDPALFFVQRPGSMYTGCCSPVPGHGVSFTAEGTARASVGVYARRYGKLGITLPMHIFKKLSLVSRRQHCYVQGNKVTIVSFDAISDSCFAVFDDQSISIPADKRLRGCLSGITPRNYEDCYFEALGAGRQNTNIIGWSPDIPFVQPYSQLKILTKPDTNPGDSGTALYNNDEQVLGFSFYRTGLGDKVEFSAWIWADSVFHTHELSHI